MIASEDRVAELDRMSETLPADDGAAAETQSARRSRSTFWTRRFPPFTPRQWRVFGISTTAGFFDNYDSALLSLAIKQIQRSLGIAEANLGNMLSAIRLGYLASFLISPLADVFGRRRLLLYTIVGYTVLTGLSAIAPHQRSFVAAQFLARAFSGAEATLSIVILAEEVDAAVRGWALGMQGAIAISGYGLAALVFGAIAIIPYGWRGLYMIALLPLAVIVPLRRILPESRRFESEAASGLRPTGVVQPIAALFRVYPGRLMITVAVWFLYAMSVSSAGFFVPKYLQEAHHWLPGRVSMLYVLGGAIGILGNIVAGRTSDHFGRRTMGALFILAEAGLAWWLYTSRSNAVISVWVLWLFCDQAAITILNAYSAELFPTSSRAAAGSALSVARYGGGALGLFLEGVLYGLVGSHWTAIRYLTIFWFVAAAAMYLLFPETAGRELEEIAPDASPGVLKR
jgi:MFS family permease